MSTQGQSNEVEKQALAVATKATAITIKSPEDYLSACEIAKNVSASVKRVTEFFAPMKTSAYAAWQQVIKTEKKVLDPLNKAKVHLATTIGVYQQEQERLRQQEEAKLREKARREAEDKVLATAQELHAEGKTAEAEAVLNEQIETPTVVAPATVQDVEGVSIRERWTFRIVDENKVPREYCSPDPVKIRGMVTAQRGLTKIPGVEVFQEAKAVVRG
jgi:hypothetical protein